MFICPSSFTIIKSSIRQYQIDTHVKVETLVISPHLIDPSRGAKRADYKTDSTLEGKMKDTEYCAKQ